MAVWFQLENLFWLGFVAAFAAFCYAGVQLYRMVKLPKAPEPARFSQAVWKGALAFLKRQCLVCVPLFLLVLLALLGLWLLGLLSGPVLPIAFLTGGVTTALFGLGCLAITLFANSRTAAAVEGGVHNSFNAAFTAGAAAAFAGVGLALTEVFTWFHVLRFGLGYDPQQVAGTLVLLGAGSAYAALLTRVSGGIFAKAADLSSGPPSGAEEEAPDFRRGPGTVADCVGDNVINAAGATDLYSAYLLALLCALALTVQAFADSGLLWNYLLFTGAVISIGAVCSLLACLLVKAGENADERSLLALLRKGAWVAAGLTAGISAPLSYLLTGTWGPVAAVVIGLLASRLTDRLSVRSASNLYHRVRRLAGAAENGVSAELAGGAVTGLRSAAGILVLLMLALLGAFLSTGGLLDAAYETLYGQSLVKGLYGVALAGAAYLSTLGYTFSAVMLAPITDNADCAAKVAGWDKMLLSRSAVLNALGGSLANLGRSLSAGATVLAVPVLVWLYSSAAKTRSGALSFAVSSPALLAGGFLGVVLLGLFLSLLFAGVQSCVQPMAAELRRQLREAARLGAGPDADYTPCVDLCARSASSRTLTPGLFAAAIPFLSSLILGPEGTAGLLLSLALVGLSGALFLSGAGSALDCARRRVEIERRGGAEARRSAVIGDMVGDLFKDVAGPALAVLVRSCFTLALLLPALAVGYSLLSLVG